MAPVIEAEQGTFLLVWFGFIDTKAAAASNDSDHKTAPPLPQSA